MTKIKEIVFPQDTAHRKKWFKGVSFSHPAKMSLGLQIYLIEHYTKPGDTILDPMFGSGSLLVACAIGRNVIGIELEQKFVDMAKANWEKIKSLGPILGYTMGTATIICGDARQLPEVLADSCIFSPPYQECRPLSSHEPQKAYNSELKKEIKNAHQVNPSNIGNLRYGEIDKVIMSPPYAETEATQRLANISTSKGGQTKYEHQKNSMANLPYGSISAICCSPPYEEAVGRPRRKTLTPVMKEKYAGAVLPDGNKAQIGNLKGESYLSAMLAVYQGCHRVLRDGGLMVLVTKNFIRNKKIVDLAADTIKLCEQTGFKLIERLKRKLMQQSFWRTIYYKKYPNAPRIEFEDVLIMEKMKAAN